MVDGIVFDQFRNRLEENVVAFIMVGCHIVHSFIRVLKMTSADIDDVLYEYDTATTNAPHESYIAPQSLLQLGRLRKIGARRNLLTVRLQGATAQ